MSDSAREARQGVGGYHDVPRLSSDVADVIAELRSLTPRVDNLTKNDGTDSTLIVLDGTIPMFHNQKKYNCPVKFWLALDYPASPPTCYVSPTREMGIKPRHVHVDNAGFIYHQYLTQWSLRSSLKELCSTLTAVFSKDPPVFAKPSGSGAAAGSSSSSRAAAAAYQRTPAQESASPQVHRPSPQESSRPGPRSDPVPSPAGKGAGGGVRVDSWSAAPGGVGSGRPPLQPQHPPPPPVAAAGGRDSQDAQGVGGGSWADNARAGAISSSAQSAATAAATAAAAAVEDESKESLLLFVMSKINAKYESFRRANEGEFDEYQAQQTRLEVTRQSIAKATAALTAERDYLQQMLASMDEAGATIATFVQKVESQRAAVAEKAPETMVHASDALAQQLMECISHDRALEDVLYELDCSLGDGKIETGEYLRLAHRLSRQQFLEKELAFKILAKRRSLAVF